jgi:hypothetical protein
MNKVHSGFYYHSAVLMDGTVYVFGGGRGHKLKSGDFSAFDIEYVSWSPLSTQDGPSPRYAHTCVLYDSQPDVLLIIFGGRTEKHGDSQEVFHWSFQNEKWDSIIPMFHTAPISPSPRAWHSAVVWRDTMYVFGGIVSKKENTDELWMYFIRNQTWFGPTLPHFRPSPRHGHSAVLYKDSMIVFAGNDGIDLNDLHRFDFRSDTWTELTTHVHGVPPFPRYTHAAVIVPPQPVGNHNQHWRMFIHGGTTGNMSHIRNGELFMLEIS